MSNSWLKTVFEVKVEFPEKFSVSVHINTGKDRSLAYEITLVLMLSTSAFEKKGIKFNLL